MVAKPQSEVARYFEALKEAKHLIKEERPDIGEKALYYEAVKIVEFLYRQHTGIK